MGIFIIFCGIWFQEELYEANSIITWHLALLFWDNFWLSKFWALLFQMELYVADSFSYAVFDLNQNLHFSLDFFSIIPNPSSTTINSGSVRNCDAAKIEMRHAVAN